MARGTLRIYLGASPGVGKTYAMLNEGWRRAQRTTDVVVGIVEVHGRENTSAQIRALEVMPRQRVEYRGTVVEEMDLGALLRRQPQVVLVDEYAHTNAPGSRNAKRWQDVEVLLDAGIDVIATLNIQHLESLNDVIGRITGTVQRETVPDAVVRRADQIELVDMSPEALRRRMAHGNIYPPERIDAALSNYFRPGNLGALRELALLWVADRVEESLAAYLDAQGITDAWETRERVVVGITGGPGGELLIRRASRMVGRVGGDLIGVHVTSDDGLRSSDGEHLAAQRRLVEELGGTVHAVAGASMAESLVAFAHTHKATQLVLGASRRSRVYEMLHGSFIARVARLAGGIDVHVIAAESSPERLHSRRSGAGLVDRRRVTGAWLLTLLGLPALTAVMAAARSSLSLETELLLFLALVLAIAAVGGLVVAGIAAVAASLLVNLFFVEPIHTFTIAEPENIVSLVVFVLVAITVGSLVDLAGRRAVEAQRARLEAEALARATATLAANPDPLPSLVELLRTTFGLHSVTIDRYTTDGWVVIATAPAPARGGSSPNVEDVAASSTSSTLVLAIGGDTRSTDADVTGAADASATGTRHRLHLVGRMLSTDDRRVLNALVDQLAVAIDTEHLVREAAEATQLAEVDAVRTALLRAVSHDLRTPLASIKAMVSGLLDGDVDWTPAQVTEALVTVDEETDRLNRLVGNLLDASRLQIGAVAVEIVDVDVADVVAQALDSLGPAAANVVVDVPPEVPLVRGDSALLERSVANCVSNAIRHGGSSPVRITAGSVGDRVHVCIIDRGPGIPVAQRDQVVAPFQRFGDTSSGDGVGLGLSIAQGFVAACGGSVVFDDTPGGGLTVTLALVASSEHPVVS